MEQKIDSLNQNDNSIACPRSAFMHPRFPPLFGKTIAPDGNQGEQHLRTHGQHHLGRRLLFHKRTRAGEAGVSNAGWEKLGMSRMSGTSPLPQLKRTVRPTLHDRAWHQGEERTNYAMGLEFRNIRAGRHTRSLARSLERCLSFHLLPKGFRTPTALPVC